MDNFIIDNSLQIFQHLIPDLKNPKKNFRAVFRDDGKNPDANVFKGKDRCYLYHDFTTGETLNPIEFIKKLRNCNFSQAMSIAKDILNVQNLEKPVFNEKSTNFTLTDGGKLSYWESYIPKERIKETLELYEVLSLRNYSFSKSSYAVNADNNNPIFAFKISKSAYKIYRPYAKGSQHKHVWLGKKPPYYKNVYGINQLPIHSQYIFIVEGYKDTIVSNGNGLISIGIDNAATKLPAEIIKELSQKSKNIIICLDNDNAGIENSKKLSEKHSLPFITIPKNYLGDNGKDISDFFKNRHPKTILESLADTAIENFNTIEKKHNQNISKLERIEKAIEENFILRYNEVTNEVQYKKINEDGRFERLNENNIFRMLQHKNISSSITLLNTLLGSDFVKRFNPFFDYFQSLNEWTDNDFDFIGKLAGYLPVKYENAFAIHFKKALVRTVACALDETIINKQALILVHEKQNSGKSTFIRWLAPPLLSDYITENISTDKDSQIALSENLIINMDELATLSKTEINSLKSIFSKINVKVRHPYGRKAITTPRRASFYGSTNNLEFLTDSTGSVRWLCFELTDKINWDYKNDFNIDDIWRQAYSLYLNGFDFELTPTEIKENEERNREFYVRTTEHELIDKYFSPGNSDNYTLFFTATDIQDYLSEAHPKLKFSSINIGKALKVLGFERVSKRTEHKTYPVKGYFLIKRE